MSIEVMRTFDHETVELDITGMTCASCAARIEKRLNKVPGVEASVNYATEKAKINFTQVTVSDLIQVVTDTGYVATVARARGADHGAERLAGLRLRLIVSALIAVPVIAISMIPALQFPGWQWLVFVAATPVVWWGGAGFHRAAWTNLRHRATTMDTLISLGTTAAYLWSVYALLFGTAGHIGMRHGFDFSLSRHAATSNLYFEAAVAIITFLLAGRYFEARSKREAGAAIRELLTLGAQDVSVLREGRETRVPIERLQVGDLFVVRPGEKVATDGEIVDGESAVDNSMVTGESIPVDVGPGDDVIGACVNATGRLLVRATRVGSDTQLAQMARLVELAQTGKGPVQRLADRISGIFVPVVLAISAVTFGGWLIAGASLTFSFSAAVAVLIIACPCALGLATPTALMVGTGRGAQLGIVIKGPEVLEQTRAVDTVVLDKTGTVTTGDMRVVDAITEEPRALAYAAAAESGSEHPIGRAVAAQSQDSSGCENNHVVTGFTGLPGAGVRALVDGQTVTVGRPESLAEAGMPASAELLATTDRARALGRTPVAVGYAGRTQGLIVVADTPKDTSAEAVRRLRRLGMTPVLLTGDHTAAAKAVAAQVGIDEVIAEVMPADKVEVVKSLQAKGKQVAMVGDGVNDAAALAQADLGIAMGTGADVAIEASDLTLVRGDLRLAADAIRLSRATLRTITTNLFWAFAYNVAAIPIAALGFLSPMFAGAAMALSSVFVVTNSLRLRRFRLENENPLMLPVPAKKLRS